MNLDKFLQQSVGEWLSQQTNHAAADARYESGRSTIAVEGLTASSPELVRVCQHHDLEPDATAVGLKRVWTGRLDGDTGDRTEETILVFLPEGDNPATGKLLCHSNAKGRSPNATGTYTFGSDGALTLKTAGETGSSQERIWFASENLRLHSTVFENTDGFSAASLSSDIRKLTAKPAA